MNWLRTLLYGPMTRDRCETCGKHLRVKQRIEVLDMVENDPIGGSGIVATFCKRDAP